MGLLSSLLLLPVTGPVHGFRAILAAIQEQVDAQMMDEARVQGELVRLSVRHSAGQISDAEYESQETALLEKLNSIRAYKAELMEAQAEASRSAE